MGSRNMTEPLNVTFAREHWPYNQLTKEEFIAKMKEDYPDWTFDDMRSTFTFYRDGEKYYVSKTLVQILAIYYGYGDYL